MQSLCIVPENLREISGALESHYVLEAIPEIDEPSFQKLKNDIQGIGVIVPIWLFDGKVIDGRARLRACNELGIPCPAQDFVGPGSLIDIVYALNGLRRHLSSHERLVLVPVRMHEVNRRLVREAQRRAVV